MNDLTFTRSRSSHAYQNNGDQFVTCNGPIDPAGRLIDLSDRPLICSSSNSRNEVVVGGSDHALYSIDIQDTRKRPVTMYTKTCGHTDWVTSVCHLADGQVLSAAMDGKLCLWSSSNRTQCIDLVRQSIHPISKVISDVRYNNAISVGYDGNIEIWNLSESSFMSSSAPQRRLPVGNRTNSSSSSVSRISPLAIMTGHTDPILECATYQNHLATGDKSGALMIWDLTRQQALTRFRAHPGPITGIECSNSSNIFISSGTDGFVKVWDPRQSGTGLIGKIPVYVLDNNPRPIPSRGVTRGGGRGTGRAMNGRGRTGDSPTAYPVSMIATTYSRGSTNDMNYIITGGGSPEDCRLVVLDTRNLFQPVASWDHHRNGIYSLCVVGDNAIFSGDGMGTVLCHHLLESNFESSPRQCLKYGLGASSQGAVRSMQCVQNKLVTCGEDGKVLIFDF